MRRCGGQHEPLTRSEVESWPALGPMNLDKQRVLDLITTNADLLVRLDTQASLRLTAEAERDDLPRRERPAHRRVE